MATDSASRPPPLDPSLILRARAALHTAGLPGDAASDEEVAGLVVEFAKLIDSMTLYQEWQIRRWWKDRLSR